MDNKFHNEIHHKKKETVTMQFRFYFLDTTFSKKKLLKLKKQHKHNRF